MDIPFKIVDASNISFFLVDDGIYREEQVHGHRRFSTWTASAPQLFFSIRPRLNALRIGRLDTRISYFRSLNSCAYQSKISLLHSPFPQAALALSDKFPFPASRHDRPDVVFLRSQFGGHDSRQPPSEHSSSFSSSFPRNIFRSC